MNTDELVKSVGYIFDFFKEANKNKDDVIITDHNDKSISIRIEFDKEGVFTIEDSKT